MIRIIHQRAKCIGCNACVEAADYRWRVSHKDGKCTLVGGEERNGGFYTVVVDDHEWDDNELAAKNCPVKIIKLHRI
ncbi:MAG: ferredoxin [Rhodothermia bacterium]|nr:ferredoxin [Rhodothermia bacterium]